MNVLTKNRILQKGDEYRDNGAWKPIPKNDFGLQIVFTKYTEVRRPSEQPKPISPDSEKPRQTSQKITGPVAIVTAKAEASRVPASGISPAGGESPSETARLAHAVSHLPTVVSIKAHKRFIPDPTETPEHQQKRDRLIIENIPYDLPMTDEEKAALQRESDREAEAERVKKHTKSLTHPLPSGVIRYPDGSDCIWTGRNGTFTGYGVEVSKLDDKVLLFPFGKRGVGNCTIQFPVSVIPQIIDRLNHYITKTPK